MTYFPNVTDMNLHGSFFATTLFLLLLINAIVSAPPRTKIDPPKEEEKTDDNGLGELGIEYERYLKEVIDVLESDSEFKRKLEAAEETDIRTGKIAHELDYVDHRVRTKLDEVKRQELERLRHLAQKEFELTNGIDVDHMKIAPPEHLNHENPHTFEIEDLKKLIAKVTNDLSEADKKRRQEFKEYEMQKEFENQEKLKHLEGTEKEAFEKQLSDNETKHKQHEPLHHPGSKQQLEEVWEKQDHMGNQEFNPRVFFQLHDLDGNGYWDQTEVKTLFLKELDKMYQMGAPEDDMRERAEEMERMREHVFKEADKNKDQLISYQEFLDQTKNPEFDKDPGWETVDQQPAYTHDEYLEFERRRQQEIQKMIQQGLIPPQPVYHVPPGYQHPSMQQFPSGHHPGQAQAYGQQQYGHQSQQGYQHHPNQIPQGHPNQIPQGHPNQIPQGHPNQIPQGHPNQIPQGHPNQVPQGHANEFHGGQMQGNPAYTNQIPQGHVNNIHGVQGQGQLQGHPNQFPQQGNPNQIHGATNQGHYQGVHPEQQQYYNNQQFQGQPPSPNVHVNQQYQTVQSGPAVPSGHVAQQSINSGQQQQNNPPPPPPNNLPLHQANAIPPAGNAQPIHDANAIPLDNKASIQQNNVNALPAANAPKAH